MKVQFLLPDPTRLRLGEIDLRDQTLYLEVSPVSLCAVCPDCQHESAQVHSRYTRKPADLPCSGLSVQLQICIRRFFCPNPACLRKTFAEQIPDILSAYARRTQRLAQAQREIAYADGGEAGARLTAKLKMPTSPDTLLRLIRSATDPETPCPRVLGVDDWALRKRHTYGTILVDLERQKVVDLLPDREPETLAQWFKDHPEIEIISRDRGDEYIQGIAQGAPQVVQVADRFHLLQNLLDVVERLLKRSPADLRQAAKICAEVSKVVQGEKLPEAQYKSPIEPAECWPLLKTHRQLRFEDVKKLQAAGCSHREIARRLKIDRRTVSKYFHLEAPPLISRQNSYGSKVLPYLDYVQKRWDEGCHNLTTLLAELQTQGFTGSYASLHRAIHGKLGVGKVRTAQAVAPKPVGFSPRQAAWTVIRPQNRLRSQQKTFRAALCDVSPQVAEAYDLSQNFRKMIEKQEAEKLDAWLKAAEKSRIDEFARFATSLRSDYEAVKAALTYSWSNGQVEGQVNRLKLIKRQMYGRANFDLLRKRVLPSALP